MKDYLVSVNTSYANGENGHINFTLKADDIDSATKTANHIVKVLNTVKSLYSFVKNFNVKNVSEITE